MRMTLKTSEGVVDDFLRNVRLNLNRLVTNGLSVHLV